MFISSFPYRKINHQKKVIGDDTYIEHIYCFRGSSNRRYIVIVEEYQYWVFAVKFCLQSRKYHPDRFNLLSGLNECSRVVTTIGMIMKKIIADNPYASFVFIGSNLPNEERNNTKRFRLYSRIIRNLISPTLFEHRQSIDNSTYLMLNRDNQESELLIKIEEMFKRIYIFI